MNWDWFYQLYSISAIFLIIGVAWKILIIPLALVSLVFSKWVSAVYMSIVVLIPNYFMASFAAFITIGVNDGEVSILLAIITGVFLACWLGMGIAQAQKEAERDDPFGDHSLITVRTWGILLTIAYYVYCLFDLRPALNSSTFGLADLASWVQNIPVVGVIVAILAFISAVWVIITGSIALVGLIFALFPQRNRKIEAYVIKD